MFTGMNNRIQMCNLSFAYGQKAVIKGLTTSIAAGEFVCVLGPNGTGKSTLAQLIGGELQPTGGRILLRNGNGSTELEEIRRHIAYLPQDIQDPPFISVRELVSLGRFSPTRSIGWRVSGRDKETVKECMDRCLVDSLADRPFDRLSGGEKQRVWLAFCLAQERDFLLLDEPLHNMDYSKKELFFKMLANLADAGKGVVLITHDLQMAERYSRRVLLMEDGELVYDGRPDGVIYSLMTG